MDQQLDKRIRGYMKVQRNILILLKELNSPAFCIQSRTVHATVSLSTPNRVQWALQLPNDWKGLCAPRMLATSENNVVEPGQRLDETWIRGHIAILAQTLNTEYGLNGQPLAVDFVSPGAGACVWVGTTVGERVSPSAVLRLRKIINDLLAF